MKRIFVTAIFLSLVLVFGILSANALTISPPLIEIDANPGEVVRQTIKIVSDTDTEGVYYPSVADFTARGEEGEPDFLEPGETKGYVLAQWIEIDRSPVVLKKGGRAEIPFAIKVPENAEPGGHYGVVFFSTQPPVLEEERTAIGVVGKLGSLILVRIAGDIREEGRLLEFGVAKGFYNRLPIEFTTRFENTGNVHLKPQGEIQISNMLGKTTAKVSMNEKGGNVLPESIRRFKSVWEKKEGVLEKGEGFFTELKKEKDNFGFGRYKAELILAGFEGGMSSFWVFPWRLLSVSLIFIAILIVSASRLMKIYNKRLIQKYQTKKED